MMPTTMISSRRVKPRSLRRAERAARGRRENDGVPRRVISSWRKEWHYQSEYFDPSSAVPVALL